MRLNNQQTFFDPFCRVKLYRPSGSDYMKTASSSHDENWTKEILKYIDSVEVTNKVRGEGLGDYHVVLNPPLEVAKAWLDGKNEQGEWLRFGVFVGLQFGYGNGDATQEFRGTVTFPAIDLNPLSPTITLGGPMATSIIQESYKSIDTAGMSGEAIILEKMKQFGYGGGDIEITQSLKSALVSACKDSVIPSGQSYNDFLDNTLPRLLRKSVIIGAGDVQLMSRITVKKFGKKIIFDARSFGDRTPDMIFRFMGGYDLVADSQIISINNFKIPINWTTFDDMYAPDAGEVVTHTKQKSDSMANTPAKNTNTNLGPSLNQEAIQAHQNKLNDIKNRYLSFNATIDTIGVPTLDVEDIVQCTNIGKLIDTAVWRVFRATHKWNKQGYSSSWYLSCINMDRAFGLLKTP